MFSTNTVEKYGVRVNIIPVNTVDEVLKHALTKTLKPVKWAEIDQASSKKDEVTSRH